MKLQSKLQIHHAIALAGLLSLSSSCAPEKQVEYGDDKTAITASPIDASRRKFRYEGELSSATSLALADATTFSMSLVDCKSSQTATITETNHYIEVYEFDRDCLVKLDTFKLNNLDYTPTVSDPFTTWAPGDKAIFESTAGDQLRVELTDTVANPVVASGTVRYQFSEITQGADTTIGEEVVRESATVAVNGQASPNFTIGQIKLVGITATGNGEFTFQLHCGQAVVGTGATMTCYDVTINSIKLVLAENTYGATALTQADLDAIYVAASGGVSPNVPADIFVPGGGTPALTRGGFITAAHGDPKVMVMAGTKPLNSHPNMILVLKAGPSYLYFKVDVEIISQDDSH